MKQVRPILMILIMMLFCCSCSIGQLPSEFVKFDHFGNGASFWLPHEFVCNSMSACGIYDPAHVSDSAIVYLGGVGGFRIDVNPNKATEAIGKDRDRKPNLNDYILH